MNNRHSVDKYLETMKKECTVSSYIGPVEISNAITDAFTKEVERLTNIDHSHNVRPYRESK